MATNFRKQPGQWEKVVPTGGATSGDVHVVTSGSTVGTCKIGVWADTYAAAATGILHTEGIFELPKQTGTGTGYAVGAIVYWDDTANRIEPGATSNTRAGKIAQATTTAATTCLVDINAT